VILARMGNNKLVITNPSKDAFETVKEVFERQEYKVDLYLDSNPNQVKAVKILDRNDKKKGKLHFSITNRGSAVIIDGHKDRFIDHHFESHHKSKEAKKELNRLQGILIRALKIKPSEIMIIKKEDLEAYD
jgi:ribose 5-phosphate isomerase